jgi:Serpin (serine protease inhibitor)
MIMIDVTEESTEAAAVAAVGPQSQGIAPQRPEPIEDFRVDHPFLFYLADNATGAILFVGRVSSPPQFAGPVAIQTPAPLLAIPAPLPPAMVGPAKRARASIKDIFEKHGLLGTFAWDCSKPASADKNWYFVNHVDDADHIQLDYMTGATTRAWYSILDKAEERSANEIYVSGTRYGEPTDGIWRVEQNRMLQVESTQGGKKIIRRKGRK